METSSRTSLCLRFGTSRPDKCSTLCRAGIGFSPRSRVLAAQESSPPMSSTPKDARYLLAFYVEAGADALLGEEATDRMADEVTASPAPAGGRPDSEAIRAGASDQRA